MGGASSTVATLGTDYVLLQAETFARLVQGQIAETRGPGAEDDPLEDYLEAEHAVVSAEGTGHARIDEIIEKRGLKRKVRLRVPSYASLEHLLQSTDLVATVPEVLVHPKVYPLALAYSKHPVELPRLSINQFWHARFHRDPANKWLRNLIADQCELPEIDSIA